MTDGNESAFPEVQEIPQFNFHTYGLSKREYIATQLMGGILASLTEKAANGRFSEDLKEVAAIATLATDELIDALNKNPK